MARPSEESAYRLLVEGSDDKYSIINLVARHGFDWEDETRVRPYVSDEGGIDGLLRAIPITLKGPYKRIGIVLDANSDVRARWAQLKERVRKADLELPESPQKDGTVIAESRIGIWLMPDNGSPGALEDFLHKLVSAGDQIRAYADEVVSEARQRGARCQEKDHLKSVLHTWLAWQEKPGLPFGTAIEAEYFGKESGDAHRFVAWFRRLFVET